MHRIVSFSQRLIFSLNKLQTFEQKHKAQERSDKTKTRKGKERMGVRALGVALLPFGLFLDTSRSHSMSCNHAVQEGARFIARPRLLTVRGVRSILHFVLSLIVGCTSLFLTTLCPQSSDSKVNEANGDTLVSSFAPSLHFNCSGWHFPHFFLICFLTIHGGHDSFFLFHRLHCHHWAFPLTQLRIVCSLYCDSLLMFYSFSSFSAL